MSDDWEDFYLDAVERTHRSLELPKHHDDVELTDFLPVTPEHLPTTPLACQGSVEALLQLARPLEEAGRAVGITSVFDDGGYRTLLLCRLFGLQALPGKGGDDARDAAGRRFELKAVNVLDSCGQERRTLGIGAGTPLEQARIERYRRVDAWIIGVFRGVAPLEAWCVPSTALEPFFARWEERLQVTPRLNNPKIPLQFIRQVGHCHPLSEQARLVDDLVGDVSRGEAEGVELHDLGDSIACHRALDPDPVLQHDDNLDSGAG